MRILRTIQVLALAAMSVASAQEPAARDQAETRNIYGRAMDFMRTGDYAQAVQAWTRYRELRPSDDRTATEQLIQAYQALGQLADRDRERERLLASRQAMTAGQRASYSVYVRDQFNAGGHKFKALEYLEPRGTTNIDLYAFSSLDTDASKGEHYMVGSYVARADTATETGLVRKGERVYSLQKYEERQLLIYRLMKERPDYDDMRSTVIAAAEAASARPVLTTMANQGPNGGLTEIILERTECYGSCPIDELVLRADGTATYNGKEYTPLKGMFSGSFPKQEFDRLAQWLVTQGFLDMKGDYGSPNADTPDDVIRVARGAVRKSVVNHSLDRSAVVAGMENVIRGAAAEIQWQPVQPARSGIRAVATWKPAGEDWRPLAESQILVYPQDGKPEITLRTDAQGKFEVALPPGTYKIEPLSFGRSLPLARPPKLNPYQTSVVVRADKFVETDFRFDRGIKK